MSRSERPRPDDPGADEDVPTDREVEGGGRGEPSSEKRSPADGEPPAERE